MDSIDYIKNLNVHLSHLFVFSRKINEIDFAASLSGEFRGAQDAGWTTTITAEEVFHEIKAILNRREIASRAELRVLLLLYCQLAEAGGVYEALKNLMGVVRLKPYLLWPFKDLVRVKQEPKRVIGPNANTTFRDLASMAKEIGLCGLSSTLEVAFRDDIRNAISHADYVIWGNELRLRKRNGGNADKLSFEVINDAINRGIGFFELLRHYVDVSIKSFHPPKEIVGRFSASFPMPWTISFEPESQSFSISGSSPAPVLTPDFQRQEHINARLGGKVLALYTVETGELWRLVDAHISEAGFEPHNVFMPEDQFAQLIDDVETLGLWDGPHTHTTARSILLASPWGFRWLGEPAHFDDFLRPPIMRVEAQVQK